MTYEDEESLRLKSRYVLERGLGGVMFWEYHADRTGALLDTLDAALRGTDVVPLSGVWRFALDPADEGLVAFWENRTLADRIRLPGVLQAQGFGDDVTVDTQWTGQIVDRSFFTAPRYEPYRQPGNVKVPFWLQPDKHYVGPRVVPARHRGPAGVEGPPRRPAPRAAALGDARLARRPGRGLERQPLDAPRVRPRHGVAPGTHRLTLRVDNRLVVDVGVNSHSVTDHTQGNWNGIVGRIELRPAPPVWIEDLQVYPQRRAAVGRSCGAASATPRAAAGRGTAAARRCRRREARRSSRRRPTCRWDASGGAFEVELALGAGAPPGTSSRPVLHRLTATLDGGRRPRRRGRSRFGLREIATQGTQFVLNGRKIFLRGTLECASSRRPATRRPTSPPGSASSASRRRTG